MSLVLTAKLLLEPGNPLVAWVKGALGAGA